MRAAEQSAIEAGAQYFPYFSIGTVFEDSETRARLEPDGITTVPLRDYLDRLLDFATRSRWGKRPITRVDAFARPYSLGAACWGRPHVGVAPAGLPGVRRGRVRLIAADRHRPLSPRGPRRARDRVARLSICLRPPMTWNGRNAWRATIPRCNAGARHVNSSGASISRPSRRSAARA